MGLASAITFAIAGCQGCDVPTRNLPAGVTALSASPPAPEIPGRELVHVIDELHRCDIEHRGLLFDAGGRAREAGGTLLGRLAWQGPISNGIEAVEHDGATWARISERTVQRAFVLTEATPIFVAVRAMGLASRTLAVSIDEQPLGTLRLARDQIRIATTPTTSLPVDPGLHTLSLRFSGRSKDKEAFGDIDWIRVGIPDDDSTTYGAPTPRDIVAPAAALSGVPHRSLALRAPGAVRCAFRPDKQTRLRSSVGVMGPGEGDAEVRVLLDGQPPALLQAIHVQGGEKATWTEVDIPLTAFANSLITLELRATQTGRGSRVLFGDPMLVGPPTPPPAVARVHAVVIVVINGVERPDLPPWSGRADPTLPTLSELAAAATTFNHHRAPTTTVSAVIASLLTGLPPSEHKVTDGYARLSARTSTIGSIGRDSSVRTGMFTGVPYTFQAFGFSSGWSKFYEHPPTSGEPATTPIDQAATWITQTVRENASARILAVIHAQGGHPPWAVGPKELEALKPSDYAGPIEPRRAAQVLARLRSKKRTTLTSVDRDRIRDLSTIALSGQDHALGNLISNLKSINLWEDTLFIVTGDVASGRSDDALYADNLDLDESVLTLPLYVHFPNDLHAGQHIDRPTEIVDIPHTALSALGLAFTADRGLASTNPFLGEPFGKDLAAVASGAEGIARDPQVAVLGNRYSTRWGSLVLSGALGAPPFLCDLELDPTCAFNRREAMPLAMMTLFQWTLMLSFSAHTPAYDREPASIDPETAAQLSVWGAQ